MSRVSVRFRPAPHRALRVLRGPLTDPDREQITLGVVCEAARAQETLAEPKQRFDATAMDVEGNLPMVEHSLVRVTSALSQLGSAVEEPDEAVAQHAADAD